MEAKTRNASRVGPATGLRDSGQDAPNRAIRCLSRRYRLRCPRTVLRDVRRRLPPPPALLHLRPQA
eukprot:9343247-Heterocapsa_arctica.AAC.1